MRVCIHRGSHEIGGSCVEIESKGARIIVGMGLPLDADQNYSKYLPNIQGLDGRDSSLIGILISHAHIDHFGLLAHVSNKIPVGMGAYTSKILNVAAPFMNRKFSIPEKCWHFRSQKPFRLGPFKITPFLVDHSAYDAYALLIESEGKKLFYSGDFRIHGRKSSLVKKLIEFPPEDINVLLLEGSSLGRLDEDQDFPTEKEVEKQLVRAFTSSEGLALVHASAQNIDRIVSIMRASKRAGRKLVLDLYASVVLEATGNPNIPQSHWTQLALYIPQAQRVKIKNNAWFDTLKRHSSNRIFIKALQADPQKYTMLFRPVHMKDLEFGQCLEKASYIYSLWEGYWDQGSYKKTENWLFRHGIDKLSIHTSGHAAPRDLQKFVEAMEPGTIVPIHSFMPERYPELFPNVAIHEDGDWWEVI